MELAGLLTYGIFFLTLVGIYGLLALGLNVQWGYTGMLNIGVAAFFAVGAYTAAILTTAPNPGHLGGFSLPFPLAFAEVISGDGRQVYRERIDLTDTGTFGQRIDDCFVQTLAGSPRASAQSGVQGVRNATNRVLHAFIVCCACSICNQACGERAVAPLRNCYRIPAAMSFAEAAAMGLVYLTAYFALVERTNTLSKEELASWKDRLEKEGYERSLGEHLVAAKRITPVQAGALRQQQFVGIDKENDRLISGYRANRFEGVSRPLTRNAQARIETATLKAAATLRDHKERLQHLIALETGAAVSATQNISGEFVELFGNIGEVCRKVDQFLAERGKATSPMVQAQLFGRGLELSDAVSELQRRVAEVKARAEEELKSSHEQLRALAARLESIREEERKKISREIHDHLGQVLTGLKMDLCSLEEDLSQIYSTQQNPLIDQVRAMSNLTDVLVEEVRKIARELRPAMLDSLGLVSAIEWQVQDFQKRTGIQCEFKSDTGLVSLDQELSTAVFRIFQETLTNVVRHANATRVSIRLNEDPNSVTLEVKDNGRGITEEEISHPQSLGLLGIKERALLFGGKVNITGLQGKGTTITVHIPFGDNI